MSRFADCPVANESPDPCPKCGATVSGNDPVNGVCQAGKGWDRATELERERCAEIVGMARFGEIDRDWRSIIHLIEGGQSVAEIRALTNGLCGKSND